ncbi:MAG: helix-turn-helix domain-containing protein [Candidatus Woesearchaeota archaeon]
MPKSININSSSSNNKSKMNNLIKKLDNRNLNKIVKEILLQLMRETRQNYPISLKVADMAEITNYSENSIYLLLEQDKIPAAKKLKGWRVPRDIFLIWWYGSFYEDNIEKAV